ncbi:nucleotidyltransferase domain-containing protein [Oscillatoria amoena NRMC-F 0135]|nr:nucleotidyltransferase domain-containing protein [Oscillatoria amoena NRMC-F 0135]
MFTRKAVEEITSGFLAELKKRGFKPTKAILFGSYAKGTPHEHSDIDLAVWDDQFTGCLPIDIEQLHDVKRKFHPLLEIHTFHSSESEDTNPFIAEILKNGVAVRIQ